MYNLTRSYGAYFLKVHVILLKNLIAAWRCPQKPKRVIQKSNGKLSLNQLYTKPGFLSWLISKMASMSFLEAKINNFLSYTPDFNEICLSCI